MIRCQVTPVWVWYSLGPSSVRITENTDRKCYNIVIRDQKIKLIKKLNSIKLFFINT